MGLGFILTYYRGALQCNEFDKARLEKYRTGALLTFSGRQRGSSSEDDMYKAVKWKVVYERKSKVEKGDFESGKRGNKKKGMERKGKRIELLRGVHRRRHLNAYIVTSR